MVHKNTHTKRQKRGGIPKMTDKTEMEMCHNYLQRQWYSYECADKKQIDKIIKEELSKKTDERFDRIMLKIRRRCIAEC